MSNGVSVLVPVLRYINRDQDDTRRAFVESGAAAQGYSTERVAAIDGHADGFADAHAGRIGGTISPGTQACFLSHALAWARIAAGDAPYGLVCEDDAAFLRPAAELAPYLGRLDTFDVIFLNARSIAYRDYAKCDPAVPLVPLHEAWDTAMSLPRDPSFPRFSRNIRDIKAPGGDFYAMTKTAAQRLVDAAARDGATTDVDCWLFFKCLPSAAIDRHRRRFIPRTMREAGVVPMDPPLRGAIVDRAFVTTQARRAGGRVRNPVRDSAE